MYVPNRADRRFQALLNGELFACFGGGKSPSTPDYEGAAEKTAASDREALSYQTWANRPEQNMPWGSQKWDSQKVTDPATGEKVTKWTQNTTLNEDSQRALDAQLGLMGDRSELAQSMYGRMADEYGTEMDWGNLPEIGGAAGARQRGEDAIYGRATSRLDPQWEQTMDQTEAKLAAQGLRPGDKAYDQAMDNLNRQKTDAYQQATYGSIMGGGQEGERTFNMESQDRNRALAEEMQKRGFSLNEINAIISGQQVGMPSMPSFNAAGKAQGVDYSGAAQAGYDADLASASQDQAALQGWMQGGASMAMMSDRRLKRNITLIGSFKQYPLYLFQYLWGTWAVGVMADEVNQDAVTRLPNGYDMVDLARVV